MAININDNIQVNSPKHIDAKYMKFSGGICQPYVSAAEANSLILSAYRYQYLTALCLMNGDLVEYWYQGGTADINLVPKSKESYTFNVTSSILLQNGYLYTKIVVIAANPMTLTIGSTLGGTDIEPGTLLSVGVPYTTTIAIYGNTTTIYLGGLVNATKVILYKEY